MAAVAAELPDDSSVEAFLAEIADRVGPAEGVGYATIADLRQVVHEIREEE